MVYVTSAQVKAVVDTDITDSEVTEMIEETDARMDLDLDTGSLPIHILRLISRTWVAYRCMLKDPNAQSIGEYREDRTETLKLMKEEIDSLLASASGGIAFRYGFADLRWPLV